VRPRGSAVLPWIVAFKAFKTATLTTVGVVLLATRQADPVDLVMRLAMTVHLPLTSALFDRALRFAMGLTPSRHVALAVTAFGYAALMGTEGVGLYLRRPWARWFTIAATSSLIPIEVYEIIRAPHAALLQRPDWIAQSDPKTGAPESAENLADSTAAAQFFVQLVRISGREMRPPSLLRSYGETTSAGSPSRSSRRA
jgi:uncharacterized membrane protein (DUF2068 family)